MNTTRNLLFVLAGLIVITGAFFVYEKKLAQKNEAKTTVAQVPKPIEKESIVLGTTYLSNDFYPAIHLQFYEIALASHVYEPLVTFNQSNKVVPLIAEKWDNPDDLTWRFYLNLKAKFSNGAKVTAEDVKFSFEYIQKNNEELASALPVSVEKINVIDDQTIEFKTKTPDPILLNRLAMAALQIMSKKEVEANGVKNNIGSGQYKLVELTEDSLKLTRNDSYWGTKAKIKNMTYKIIPKEDDRVTALLNKEIDYMSYGWGSSSENIAKIEKAVGDKLIQKKQILDPSIAYLALDTTRDKSPYISTPNNPLKELKVRKAIYQALDLQSFSKNFATEARVANQLVSNGIFGYNTSIKRLSYNVEEAKKLIKEAGYEQGFEMTIDTYKDERTKEMNQSIIDQLAAINIKVKINEVDGEVYGNKVVTRDSSAYIGGWSSDTADAIDTLEALVHTATDTLGSYNLGYSNQKIDLLIEEASKTMNQKTRGEKLKEAMKLAMDDVSEIPLSQNYVKSALANDILWTPRLDGAVKVYEMAGKGE